MRYTLPDYIERFHCIGGTCPDTCCAGWEVDIDDDTYEYYANIESPLGDLMRQYIHDEDGDRYIAMTPEGRCPMLDECNLCRIISELGEASLSQVCMEYPRYFARIGDHEQIDMSLSCMELGRLFFEEEGPFVYRQIEDVTPAAEELDEEDEAYLNDLIELRDHLVEILQEEKGELQEKLERVREEVLDFSGLPAPGDLRDEELLSLMEGLEILDGRWVHETKAIREALPQMTEERIKAFLSDPTISFWYQKLAVYFTFRYTIDAFYDGDPRAEYRMTLLSLRVNLWMGLRRFMENGGSLSREEMIDLAHLYSKQVEHSEENVAVVKGL